MLPPQFVTLLHNTLPDADALIAALETTPALGIRLNPAKSQWSEAHPVPWSRWGYTLSERPRFILDPRFHAGAYYVQDPSCMALERVLEVLNLRPRQVLDACAAPGGKSTHLASIYPEALILANEVIRSRANVLAENVSKWGSGQIVVSQADPQRLQLLGSWADLMVVDAPCSGEGLFRKDPDARKEWSLAHVHQCAARQRRILADLWPVLKPGGVLVYSTCTYNRFENEAQLDWLLDEMGAEALSWQLPAESPMVIDNWRGITTLHCYPHRMEGEGFFLACVAKPERQHAAKARKVIPAPQLQAREQAPIQDWLHGDWLYTHWSEGIAAWPQSAAASLAQLCQLPLVAPPLALAEPKGKTWKPSAALALHPQCQRTAFPTATLNLEEAIAFLQGHPLNGLALPRGFHRAEFEGWSLGWLNQIEQRANNGYPSHWRIRMQPDAVTLHNAWQQLQRVLPLEKMEQR
ncbi:MAG: rRNA methyltransferase [Candidatus Sericytochromatia bacterium]